METQETGRIKILVVDDNAEMRSEIRASIPSKRIEWFEATDGDEVTPLYDKIHPTIVLMDVRMRRMDGITATRELLKVHPEARVITLTQNVEPMYRTAARDAGAVAYFGKDDLVSLHSKVIELAGLHPRSRIAKKT